VNDNCHIINYHKIIAIDKIIQTDEFPSLYCTYVQKLEINISRM